LIGPAGVANTTAANSTDETAHRGGIDVARVRHGMPAGERDALHMFSSGVLKPCMANGQPYGLKSLEEQSRKYIRVVFAM
jgi:hypothetical protein